MATGWRIPSALQMLVIWAMCGCKAAVFPLSVLFQCKRNNSRGVTGNDVLWMRTPAASTGVCSGECRLCCWLGGRVVLHAALGNGDGLRPSVLRRQTGIECCVGDFLVRLVCLLGSELVLSKIPNLCGRQGLYKAVQECCSDHKDQRRPGVGLKCQHRHILKTGVEVRPLSTEQGESGSGAEVLADRPSVLPSASGLLRTLCICCLQSKAVCGQCRQVVAVPFPRAAGHLQWSLAASCCAGIWALCCLKTQALTSRLE